MEEKRVITITVDDFNKAVKKVNDDWGKTEDSFEKEMKKEINSMTKLIMSLQNTIFAGMLRDVLFNEDNEVTMEDKK